MRIPRCPPRLPSGPDWLKADRAYQIATAYLYRYDYARAAELYAAIGQDAASPWRQLARYLAARAAVHAAIVAQTPERIAAADAAIAGIAADPELAAYHADAPRLASLLAFATQPQQRAQELARSLFGADLPAALAVDLHDLEDLERTGKRYTDVGAWLYDIDALNGEKGRQNAAVKADVLARWRDGHALPWLVAVMMFLEPNDPDAAPAMAAAQAIDAGSPAYYTLAWNRLRLLIGQGKTEEAAPSSTASWPRPRRRKASTTSWPTCGSRSPAMSASSRSSRCGTASFSCISTTRAPSSTRWRCRCRRPSGTDTRRACSAGAPRSFRRTRFISTPTPPTTWRPSCRCR